MEQRILNLTPVKSRNPRNSVFNLDIIGRNDSAESLYSSGLSPSVSLPDNSSSLDSVDFEKIGYINKNLSDLLQSRLTAFAFFEEMDKGSRKHYKKSSMSECESSQDFDKEPEESRTGDGTSVSFSETYKKLNGLKKVYENQKKKLNQTNSELEKLRDEESELNDRLYIIENKVTRAFLGIKEKKLKCGCKIC